jgi:hypothetical protein
MQLPRKSLSSALAFLLAAMLAPTRGEAAVVVTIQPGQDLQSVVWSVTWNSLDGVIRNNVVDLGFIEPLKDEFHGNYLEYHRQVGWFYVGNFLGDYFQDGGDFAYVDRWYSVTSDTPGWLICPFGDLGSAPDNVFFGNNYFGYNDPFPTSGAFKLTIPGGRITDYNPGVYASNPNVTVTVTTTPVPEPAGLGLFGVAATLLCHRRQRSRML